MAKSILDAAIDMIDAKIADLERSKMILKTAALDAADPVAAPKAKRGRKAKAKPGLPGISTAVQAVGDLE